MSLRVLHSPFHLTLIGCIVAATATGCTTVPAVVAGAEPTPTPARPGGHIQLGQAVSGRIGAEGEAHDYRVVVESGQSVTASLDIAGPGPERTLQLLVFRRHPVTQAIEEELGRGLYVNWPDQERGAATMPFDGPGEFVFRVTSGSVMVMRERTGPYRLQVRATTRGAIQPGQTVASFLDAAGATDDYVYQAGDVESVAAFVEAPYDGREGGVTVRVYQRDPATRELIDLGREATAHAETGRPAATDPIEARGLGELVIRVSGQGLSPYRGPYRLSLRQVR